MQQFLEVHPDGDRAECIAGCDDRRKASIEREMQQYCGKQAQDREAEEHYCFRQARISGGSKQGCKGPDVPQESQAGRGEQQPASAKPRTGEVPQQQVQKDAEDNRSSRVADGVNELSFVESGQPAWSL